MVDESEKKQEADKVVNSLDELFPEEAQAGTQPVEAQTSHQSQGGTLGVNVLDSNNDKKDDMEYIRVPDMGSVEAVKLGDGSWAVTRRDKLPHNKEDKL